MKSLEKKAFLAMFSIREKARQFMKDKRGSSELVVVLLLIVIAIVAICVLFWPDIKTWFGTMNTKFTAQTTDMFDLK